MTRVFIVDDHSLFAEGLKSMLAKVGNVEVVGMAHNGNDALRTINSNDVDLVLLDINLPDKDGIFVCGELMRDFPELKILALSMHSEASIIASMLDAGAMGYVLKNAKSDELQDAIECAMQGKRFLSSEASNNLIYNLMGEGDSPRKSKAPALTRREKDVLYLIMKEHTTSEIAEQLFVSPSTVETHRKNLLQKLEVRNVVGLAQVALEFDLLADYSPPKK